MLFYSVMLDKSITVTAARLTQRGREVARWRRCLASPSLPHGPPCYTVKPSVQSLNSTWGGETKGKHRHSSDKLYKEPYNQFVMSTASSRQFIKDYSSFIWYSGLRRVPRPAFTKTTLTSDAKETLQNHFYL
ncbi:hypothetical protein E2C01_000522 [Portunus trituberculatus]|uniref:Uncharacterized protein n=1 Tax=Portunus trituberculatus TaxID=210409 RepID=A0A5B7CJZ1_PORTR|nr:hypothetical protein [Portunus trituberculatus]